jgi:hypothetical protein
MSNITNNRFEQGLLSLLDTARDIEDCWVTRNLTQQEADDYNKQWTPDQPLYDTTDPIADEDTQLVETHPDVDIYGQPTGHGVHLKFANGQTFLIRWEATGPEEFNSTNNPQTED